MKTGEQDPKKSKQTLTTNSLRSSSSIKDRTLERMWCILLLTALVGDQPINSCK
jgi:hypothetical protein